MSQLHFLAKQCKLSLFMLIFYCLYLMLKFLLNNKKHKENILYTVDVSGEQIKKYNNVNTFVSCCIFIVRA